LQEPASVLFCFYITAQAETFARKTSPFEQGFSVDVLSRPGTKLEVGTTPRRHCPIYVDVDNHIEKVAWVGKI
jgi:hypothetical protein